MNYILSNNPISLRKEIKLFEESKFKISLKLELVKYFNLLIWYLGHDTSMCSTVKGD